MQELCRARRRRRRRRRITSAVFQRNLFRCWRVKLGSWEAGKQSTLLSSNNCYHCNRGRRNADKFADIALLIIAYSLSSPPLLFLPSCLLCFPSPSPCVRLHLHLEPPAAIDHNCRRSLLGGFGGGCTTKASLAASCSFARRAVSSNTPPLPSLVVLRAL